MDVPYRTVAETTITYMKSLRNIQLKLLASMMYAQHRFSLILCLVVAWFTKNECVAKSKVEKHEGRNCALYAQFRPVSPPWFNWIFSITLCRNTDKYKLQAVLHTMWNALEVQSCWLLDFFLATQLASYMDVRSNEAAPRTARPNGSVTYNYLYEKS